MNCRYVQSHLSAYIDMELAGAEQQQIRAHLETCLECSAEYETLLRVKHLVRRLPIVRPTCDGEVILQRIRAHRVVPSMPRRLPFHTRWWRYAWGAVAVALVLWLTPRDENSPIRPLQSDTLTLPLTNASSKYQFSFPFPRQSEPRSIISPSYTPVHMPVMPASFDPFSPFMPNPALMPVVDMNQDRTGSLQPVLEVQTR